MLLKNGTVYIDGAFHAGRDVMISEGLFSGFVQDGEVLDCTGLYVIPGLIDIHTHGALGYDAMDADPKGLSVISEYMLHNGITTFLPTLMTASESQMRNAFESIRSYADHSTGADIPGIYMEGPYFSPEWAGAQHPDHIRDISLKEFEDLLTSGFVKVISIAPEKTGSGEFIEKFRSYTHIAAGHTDANFQQMEEAKAKGLSILTHTFNGMPPMHHRDPGPVGSGLEGGLFCEFICDGLHLSPAIVRMLFKQCPDRLVMISDSIRPAGLSDGTYLSGGQEVILSRGVARLASGTIAGSTSNLLKGLQNAVNFGIDLAAAVKTATETPAIATGIFDQYGSIAEGKVANLILLNEKLELVHVIHRGQLVK